MPPRYCPECKQPRFAFVFLPDGGYRCTDCQQTRLAIAVEEQHAVSTVVANKWVFLESRPANRSPR